MALTRLDTFAQLIGPGGIPGGLEIIVILAQIANRLRADTAGPDIAIGSDLGGGHASHTRDHLTFLNQRALHKIVIAIPKRLCHPRDAAKLGLPDALLQAFNHWTILLNRWGDAHAYGIQFDPLFSNLANERVGLELVAYEGVDVLELIHIEV